MPARHSTVLVVWLVALLAVRGWSSLGDDKVDTHIEDEWGHSLSKDEVEMKGVTEVAPKHQAGKGLFLLFGATFRDAGNPALRGGPVQSAQSPVSVRDRQLLASESQQHFFESMKQEHGIGYDVLLSTYRTPWDADLSRVFNGNLIGANFKTWWECTMGPCKAQHHLIWLQEQAMLLEPYSFYFFIRADVYLKPAFLAAFDPGWTQLKVPFLTSTCPLQRIYNCQKPNNMTNPSTLEPVPFVDVPRHADTLVSQCCLFCVAQR